MMLEMLRFDDHKNVPQAPTHPSMHEGTESSPGGGPQQSKRERTTRTLAHGDKIFLSWCTGTIRSSKHRKPEHHTIPEVSELSKAAAPHPKSFHDEMLPRR